MSVEERDRLREATKAFIAKFDALMPALTDAFLISSIHGMPYIGPTWEVELTALRAALRMEEGERGMTDPAARVPDPTTAWAVEEATRVLCSQGLGSSVGTRGDRFTAEEAKYIQRAIPVVAAALREAEQRATTSKESALIMLRKELMTERTAHQRAEDQLRVMRKALHSLSLMNYSDGPCFD